LLFVVVTLALMAFALPSSAAPAKIFGLTMDTYPTPGQAVLPNTTVTLSAKYTNLTPNGNSTINWVHLTVPAGMAITNIVFPQGGSLYSQNGNVLVVNNIPGIGSGGQSWLFTVTVSVPPAGCTSYTFGAEAYTGNSGTQGQPFAYQATFAGPPPFTSKPDIAVTSGCVLQFQKQPAGAQVNTTITSVGSDTTGAPVQVALTDGTNPVASFNGTISLAIKLGTGTAGAILSGGSATASSGVATFPSLSIDTVGLNYRLIASAFGATSPDSNAFSIFANGDIGCVGGRTTATNNYNSVNGKTDYTYDPDGSNTPSGNAWGLRRGANYLLNQQCVLVDYTFIPPTAANNYVATLLYDRTTGQQASWKYLVAWPTGVAVDSTNPTKGWTTYRPWQSWGIDNPNSASGSPDYVPAQFCLGDPGDLTQRTAAELFALLPKLPNDCDPAHINDGPFCKANAAHPTVYYLDDAAHPAKMCISQQGFSTGPGNTIFPWSEIVDQADGFTRSP